MHRRVVGTKHSSVGIGRNCILLRHSTVMFIYIYLDCQNIFSIGKNIRHIERSGLVRTVYHSDIASVQINVSA